VGKRLVERPGHCLAKSGTWFGKGWCWVW